MASTTEYGGRLCEHGVAQLFVAIGLPASQQDIYRIVIAVV